MCQAFINTPIHCQDCEFFEEECPGMTENYEPEFFGHEAYCEFEPCTTCPANGCSKRQSPRTEDTAFSGPYVEHITIHDVEWYQPAF